ncbi:MAG: hypothetical protein OXI95_03480 [bacterium]|nr:hypothetical protein [bacterium]
MPVHFDNIGKVILDAWNDPRRGHIEPDSRKNENWQRSRNWVDALAKQFRKRYSPERHRVFWSKNEDNQQEFGLNELLFDIAVCSVSTTKSLEHHSKDLLFVSRCHWQIESEFSLQNTRDLVVDMSKLVMGTADNKLFVASHRGDREADILEQCAPIAGCCVGTAYFCFISHPEDWHRNRERVPTLHEWVGGGWAEVDLPSAG